MKKLFFKIFSWWNQNSTKRWLLFLDRICICWIAWLVFGAFKDAGGLTGEVLTQADVIFFAALLFFLILYTPSYMFPESSKLIANEEQKKEP